MMKQFNIVLIIVVLVMLSGCEIDPFLPQKIRQYDICIARGNIEFDVVEFEELISNQGFILNKKGWKTTWQGFREARFDYTDKEYYGEIDCGITSCMYLLATVEPELVSIRLKEWYFIQPFESQLKIAHQLEQSLKEGYGKSNIYSFFALLEWGSPCDE